MWTWLVGAPRAEGSRDPAGPLFAITCQHLGPTGRPTRACSLLGTLLTGPDDEPMESARGQELAPARPYVVTATADGERLYRFGSKGEQAIFPLPALVECEHGHRVRIERGRRGSWVGKRLTD